MIILAKIKDYIDIAYRKISSQGNNRDLLLNINESNSDLSNLRVIINNFTLNKVIKKVLNYINLPSPDSNKLNPTIERFIIFLGKTYKFSSNLSLKTFFQPDTIRKAVKQMGGKKGEYFKFLSRVAINKELQILYFNNFTEYHNLDSYLWGYGRMLAWYVDFYFLQQDMKYLDHFQSILIYLKNNYHELQSKKYEEYKRNAFLSLIYLLTFRELNNDFCKQDSEVYKLAEKVVNLYKNEPIFLNSIDSTKSLSFYFDELLHGNGSGDDIGLLLKVES